MNLLIALGTQWRIRLGGCTGLDYSAVKATLDIWDVPPGDRPELFECLRILEDAALEQMAADAERRK